MHVNVTKSTLNMIHCKKHNCTEHILRDRSFLHDITEGKMMGKPNHSRIRTE